MSEAKIVRKSFSIPNYLASRLESASRNTAISQSSLLVHMLCDYLHRFDQEGSLEQWIESTGRDFGYKWVTDGFGDYMRVPTG